MKATKKIISAILAVMILAMMIPFTVSAAGSNTLTVNGKAGYTFTLYKVADLDSQTGAYDYDNAASTEIGNILKGSTAGISSADLLTECNKLDTSTLTAVKTFAFAADATTLKQTETVGDGVYYLKATAVPAGVKAVTNSVLSLPYYEDNVWKNTYTINAAGKVNDGTPKSAKKIKDGNSLVDSISAFTQSDATNNVTFVLTGDVAGSASQKVKSYNFVDTMGAGLDSAKIESARLYNVDANGAETGTPKDITSSVSLTATAGTFNAVVDKDLLGNNEFYSYDKVEVVYTARLNENAEIGTEGNPNTVKVAYKNSYDVDCETNTTTVYVYSFELNVEKVDAADDSKKLSGADFVLYTDSECKTVATNGAKVTTDDNGKAKFTGLKAGRYYLREEKAPEGYNINSKVFAISISDTGVVTSSDLTVENGTAVVPDALLIVPQTGGMGTMMFTIGGAALIACAGILFFIVRRKKTAE